MFDSLKLGVVVAAYPQDNSVDILCPEDGGRLFGVQVMVPTGSSNTGVIDLPDIGLPLDESRWSFTAPAERYVRAVLAFMSGHPIVLGFLLPPESQITFAEKNRRIMRHASDVYSSIDNNGNAEFYHPSGAYIRFGTSGSHENLESKDFDKKWKITKNTDKAVHIHIEQAGGTASIDIAPNGAITIDTASTITATAAGAVTVNAPSATINATASHCTGTLLVDGLITGTGGLAISGGSGATVSGNMAVTDGEVSADGIGLKSHHHTEQGDGAATTAAQA